MFFRVRTKPGAYLVPNTAPNRDWRDSGTIRVEAPKGIIWIDKTPFDRLGRKNRILIDATRIRDARETAAHETYWGKKQ